MTSMPILRAWASTRSIGSTAANSSEVSLPSASPNPPGSTKSRCMSMITSAVLAMSISSGKGSALIVANCGSLLMAGLADSLKRNRQPIARVNISAV